MHYRCAHCHALLEAADGGVARCADHPDGAVEWSPDEVQWSIVEGGDGLQ